MTEPGFWLDGTQDPPPAPTYADPLAGLLTGEMMPGERVAMSMLSVAAPVPPPPDHAVQAAMDALFAGDNSSQRTRAARAPRPSTPTLAAPTARRLVGEPRRRSGVVTLVTVVLVVLVLVLIVRAIEAGATTVVH